MSPIIGSLRGMLPHVASWLALLLLPLTLRSQYKLPLYENGLIYDATTLRTLRHICDSMQERFRAEPPSGPYRSLEQTIGSFIRLRGTDEALATIERKMDSGASFDGITGRFQEMMIDSMREIALAKREWRDRRFRGITYAARLTIDPYDEIDAGRYVSIDDSLTVLPSIGWFHTMRYKEPDDSIGEMIALYVATPPRCRQLPERYARLVQFVDFMVDTNTDLKLVNDNDEQMAGSFDDVMDAIHGVIDPPEEHVPAPASFTEYLKGYEAWIEDRGERMEKAMRQPAFADKVRSAAKTGISENRSDPDLEFLVEHYVSKELALELVRRRRLVRMCLSDGADIAQYHSIARLAAETGRWDIFPRAHLRIIWPPPYNRLNDITEPGARRTYVRELDAIGLDLPALVIGQALKIDNPAGNHFALWSAAAAVMMAESEAGKSYEEHLLGMIDDPELDDFNRSVMYTLYVDYLAELGSQAYATARLAALKARVDELPAYIGHDLLKRQLTARER
jgi:hypothetical protein